MRVAVVSVKCNDVGKMLHSRVHGKHSEMGALILPGGPSTTSIKSCRPRRSGLGGEGEPLSAGLPRQIMTLKDKDVCERDRGY